MRYLDTFIPISNALEPFSVSHCYDKIERERELEFEEKKNAKEKKERKKVLGIGHDRAHVRISRLGGGLERLKIPDRHVFAAYKSTTFQRSRCSAIRCEGAYVRNDRWIFSND